MEAQAALGGADGGGELYAIAAVDLHLALIVHPGDAEHQAALGLHDAVDDAGLHQLRPLGHHGLEGLQDLAGSLEELGLLGVFPAQSFINALKIRIGELKCHSCQTPLLGGPYGGRTGLIFAMILTGTRPVQQPLCHVSLYYTAATSGLQEKICKLQK